MFGICLTNAYQYWAPASRTLMLIARSWQKLPVIARANAHFPLLIFVLSPANSNANYDIDRFNHLGL